MIPCQPALKYLKAFISTGDAIPARPLFFFLEELFFVLNSIVVYVFGGGWAVRRTPPSVCARWRLFLSICFCRRCCFFVNSCEWAWAIELVLLSISLYFFQNRREQKEEKKKRRVFVCPEKKHRRHLDLVVLNITR